MNGLMKNKDLAIISFTVRLAGRNLFVSKNVQEPSLQHYFFFLFLLPFFCFFFCIILLFHILLLKRELEKQKPTTIHNSNYFPDYLFFIFYSNIYLKQIH
jgi:4-amino-4-deoxy-L-arabinose transferase-like glycosyltransferase